MKTIVATALVLCILTISTTPSQAKSNKKKCYKTYNIKAKNSCRRSLKGRYTIEDCCNNQGGQAHGLRKKGQRGVTSCTPCTNPVQPVDNWGEWGIWPTKCDVICGKGIIQVRRRCRDLNGKDCAGPSIKRKECVNPTTPHCPVHGGWSGWGNWSACSSSCDRGKQLRFRSCSNPKPQYGGQPCQGARESKRDCIDLPHCPIHGNWGKWGHWSACSVTCDIGRRQRGRKCDNPKPKYNGRECNPPDGIFKQSCNTYKSCTVIESSSGCGSGSGSGSGEFSGDCDRNSGDGSGSASGSGASSGGELPTSAAKEDANIGEDFDFAQADGGAKKISKQ